MSTKTSSLGEDYHKSDRISGYQFRETLHKGVRSRVVRALRTKDKRPVLIKTASLDRGDQGRDESLQREFEVGKHFKHGHISSYYDLVETSGGSALILEDFAGTSLDRILPKDGFPIGAFLDIAAQIARGLEAVHREGVVHRDIKPANIIHNSDKGRIKLIDFGSAQESKSGGEPTIAKGPVGTLAYMAPEQTGRMNRAIDHRSDLYGLGVTFYELLTGQRPFLDQDPLELIHAHLARRPVPPSEVRSTIAPILSDIVMMLLSKDPGERYQSAAGLLADLDQCLVQFRETNQIQPFPLGTSDFREGLSLPVERSLWKDVRESLDKAQLYCRGGNKLLFLLDGEPGTGKTSFLKDFSTGIPREQTLYLLGTGDSVRRDTPYFPLVEAIRGVLRQILSSEQEEVDRWKVRLDYALGSNGRLMTDLLPELLPIIGEQPEIQKLPPTEARNRFQLCLLGFLQALFKPYQLVVLVIDDTHLCDRATEDALVSLLNHPETNNLLTIWSLQSSNLDKDSTLRESISKVRESNVPVEEGKLRSFDPDILKRVLSKMLRLSEEKVAELTRVIYNKTKGSAFFIQQFLSLLYSRKIIDFDQEKHVWTWDIQRIEQESITENVAQYLSDALEGLSDQSRDTLSAAATIGTEFTIDVVARICDEPYHKIAENFLDPIREGFISVVDGSSTHFEQLVHEKSKSIKAWTLRFGHENVRLSSYELSDSETRKKRHLLIGQTLKKLDKSEIQKNIFEVVRHINNATDLLDKNERYELAELNLKASQKARDQGAPDQFQALCQKSLDLLGEGSWEKHYQLTLDVHLSLAEAALLVRDFEGVKELEKIVRNQGESLDKYRAAITLLAAFTLEGKHPEAIEYGRKVLVDFDIHLPEKPSTATTLASVLKLKALLAGKNLKKLENRAEMTDPRELLIIDILSAVVLPVYLSFPDYLPYLCYFMIQKTLRYGNCGLSPLAYALHGLICMGVLGQVELGYKYARLALNIFENLKTKRLYSSAATMFGYLVRHWKEPFKNNIEFLDEFYKLGIENGDLAFAGYCLEGSGTFGFFAGHNLSHIEETKRKQWELLDNFGNKDVQEIINSMLMIFEDLISGPKDIKLPNGQIFDEKAHIERWKKGNKRVHLHAHYWTNIFRYFFLGEYDEVRKNVKQIEQYLDAGMGTPMNSTRILFTGIVQLDEARGFSEFEKRKRLAEVLSIRQKFKKFAHHCPENHRAPHLILEAYTAWAKNHHYKALKLFDQAEKIAEENGLIYYQALACEFSARLALEVDDTILAGARFRKAAGHYFKWGATYKAQLILNECAQYPYITYENTSTYSTTDSSESIYSKKHGELDFLSVMKSALAISQELNMERLLVRILTICNESAGGERGALFLKTDQGWMVQARLEGSHCVPENESLENSDGFSTSIIRYIIRTDEDFVTGNVLENELFESDEYLKKNDVKSVLCVRLMHKGVTRGLLYLENNLTFGAFTKQRVEILKVLLSQAAVSVENSSLLEDTIRLNTSLQKHRDHLEDLVEERTAELKEAQGRLVEASRRAGMAEVAVDVLHNVGNTLNSINVTSEVLSGIVSKSKVDSLNLGVNLLLENQDNLGTFVTEDPKGKKIPLLFEQVTKALQRERESIQENLGNLAENIDHIKKIVSKQQKYASAPDVSEEFELIEVLDDALQIHLSDFERYGIEIEKLFSNVPRIKADKHKILQILTSLLSNAVHSVRDAKCDSPTIKIRLNQNGSAKVKLEVQDNGLGIAQKDIAKIFGQGYTTRESGLGMGLHSSANAAKELGGSLVAQSEGPGTGATFVLEVKV